MKDVVGLKVGSPFTKRNLSTVLPQKEKDHSPNALQNTLYWVSDEITLLADHLGHYSRADSSLVSGDHSAESIQTSKKKPKHRSKIKRLAKKYFGIGKKKGEEGTNDNIFVYALVFGPILGAMALSAIAYLCTN